MSLVESCVAETGGSVSSSPKVEQPLPFPEWNVGEGRCGAENILVKTVPRICRLICHQLGELIARPLYFSSWPQWRRLLKDCDEGSTFFSLPGTTILIINSAFNN